MKRVLSLLLALYVFVSCADAQKKGHKSEPEIHKMADGLQIQSYDTRALRDDFDEMLGIWMWKIRLSVPAKHKSGVLKLELRIPGEEPKSFGGFGYSSSKKGDYVFGIQPLGSDSLFIDTSPKMRFYSRASSYDGVGDEDEYKAPGDSHVVDNPFLNLGGPLFFNEPPVRADGSVVLIQFSPSGKDDDPKNSELVVVTSSQSPPADGK